MPFPPSNAAPPKATPTAAPSQYRNMARFALAARRAPAPALLLLLIATSCTSTASSIAEPLQLATSTVDTTPPVAATKALVQTVIDGDTIVVRVDGVEETVRLLGIDTPETGKGNRTAECFGANATDFARELLPSGTTVLLTRDEETRDQYGRLLAFVHRDDGLFVNLAMIEHGYASPLFFQPNIAMRETFERAADVARREWRGFWPACGADDVLLEPGQASGAADNS